MRSLSSLIGWLLFACPCLVLYFFLRQPRSPHALPFLRDGRLLKVLAATGVGLAANGGSYELWDGSKIEAQGTSFFLSVVALTWTELV